MSEHDQRLPSPRLSQDEVSYEQKRRELVASVNLDQYLEDPFLFMKRQRVTDYLTHIKLFEKTLHVKGSVVECGVYKGGSIMLYMHLSSILEPYAMNRKIYGFDTFAGFASVSERDEHVQDGGLSDSDYKLLTESIELQDMNRAIPHIPKCELIRGDGVKTIPKFVEEHPELIISLLILDFDIYEPTMVALKHFLPLVPKGGIVAFDQVNERKWVGETIALKEMLDLNEVRLEKFPFEHRLSYFVMGE